MAFGPALYMMVTIFMQEVSDAGKEHMVGGTNLTVKAMWPSVWDSALYSPLNLLISMACPYIACLKGLMAL